MFYVGRSYHIRTEVGYAAVPDWVLNNARRCEPAQAYFTASAKASEVQLCPAGQPSVDPTPGMTPPS